VPQFAQGSGYAPAQDRGTCVSQLAAGRKIAVITDAGLPGISDPGHRLLRACQERGLPFTIPAAVGFVALSGIAVLNGIMLVSFINLLRTQGRATRDACLEGTLTRFFI